MTTYHRASPYVAGNKFSLMPQLMPHLLVEGCHTFIDLFGGSGCVSINVNKSRHYSQVIYNEGCEHTFNLQTYIKDNLNRFDVAEYIHLNTEHSKKGYLALRDSYNELPSLDKLYILQCRSFSNGIRFDKNGKFDKPWGDRRPFDKGRMIQHQNLLQNVELFNKDFRLMVKGIIESCDNPSEVCIYVDSPYAKCCATYNTDWSDEDNSEMLACVKELIEKGFKVRVSNIFENRGKIHQELINWCEENKHLVDVLHLDISYGNTSHVKSDKKTDEVLLISK